MERERDEQHEQAWRWALALLARKQVKRCAECGEEFVALYRHQVYCSARCRRRRGMREYYRRKRLSSSEIDADQ
jgi:hypothetical protein